jgi:VWFA-related protein
MTTPYRAATPLYRAATAGIGFKAVLTLVVITLLAFPQQPDPGFKITVSTNLVIVNVDVRDRNGKPIEDLNASDFTLTEDGKPQKISVFEYQRLETEAAPPALKERPATPSAPSERPVPRREITPSSPGQIRYKDQRLMVLFFDMSSMQQADQIRAQNAALKFIDQQLTPSDLVSIMAFTNRLQVMEDFTTDRDRLRTAVRALRVGEASELAAEGATGETEDSEDTGDAFTADESEFNIFNTDRKLGALESAAKMLASLPEKKTLVYFSSGVGKTGLENQSQLRSTVNAAVRSNVAFYPVDARGLVASAPAGDAAQRSPRGSGVYSGSAQRAVRDRFNNQQDTLYTLAADTGGKALLDSNDLSIGIRQAQKDVSSYYILGYYSTNPARDGRFRRLKVTLSSQPHAKLDYRSGYFADKEFAKFDSTDKERQLEEALLLGDPVTDLPIALEVNYFRISRNQYFVPVAVKIPGSSIELARSGKSDEAEMDFIGQVRDVKGRLAGTVRDMIKVRLKGADAAALSQRNLGYDSGFTLAPGDYVLKFVARENVTGKIGTFETKFNVPDLAAESQWLRTSSVVWANQREPMSTAVGAAENNRKLLKLHPLIQDGQKLLPSITRVYRHDQKLYVYFEVYDPGLNGDANSPSVTATLTLFKGRQKAFETEMLRVHEASPKRAFVVPVQFQIPLSELKPGRYTCQVSVIDELGKKFAFSRAPMVLLEQSSITR